MGRVHLMFPALCGSAVHSAVLPGPGSHSQDYGCARAWRWRPLDWENWGLPYEDHSPQPVESENNIPILQTKKQGPEMVVRNPCMELAVSDLPT